VTEAVSRGGGGARDLGRRREAEAVPEGDTRRVMVRAGWRGSGGWRRKVLTTMFSPAPQNGYTPLHRASMFDRLGVVEALLAKGADVQAKDYVSIARACALCSSRSLAHAECA
jgi:hypothetical protein